MNSSFFRSKIVVFALAAASLNGCSTDRIAQRNESRLSERAFAEHRGDANFPIIDAHVHTHFSGKPERTSGILDTKESFLREMREAGVVGMVAHTDGDGSDYVDLKAERVLHCAGLADDWGRGARAGADARRLDADLKSGKYGCIKVYLGYVHRWASDPGYRLAYDLARKHGVAVVFHTGDTYSTKAKLKYADPLTVDEIAVDYPDVKFVIAHAGNPWIVSAAEVAYKNPNVYLDGSALLIGNMAELPAEHVEELVVKPLNWLFRYVEDPRKLMFGTDWPLADVGPYVAAFKKAIPPAHWRAVFHDNAQRVFRIPGVPPLGQ